MIDLRTCSLKKGKRPDGASYFDIRDSATDESYISIVLESSEEFNRWGSVLLESTRSDA